MDGVSAERGNVAIAKMALLIGKRNMDGALHLLQDFLGTVPYCNVTNYEGHYQQMLYIIFTLLTNYLVDVEVHTPRGRVDIVLLTKTDLYVVELKLNKSAQAAMQQINLKNYRQRFALCGLPITKVGINFDSTQGTIEDWVIEAWASSSNYADELEIRVYPGADGKFTLYEDEGDEYDGKAVKIQM